jgi:hypothetical protein
VEQDNRVEQLMRRVEALSAQNQSLHSSLSAQASEAAHLRSLLDAVDADRSGLRAAVDAEVSRERALFEERSAKVLAILQARDATIAGLADENEALRDGAARRSAEQARGRDEQGREVERLRDRLIELTQRGREQDAAALDAIRAGAPPPPASDDGLQDQYSLKAAAAEEQAGVLVAEVNSLRAAAAAARSRAAEDQAREREESGRLGAELEEARRANGELGRAYDAERARAARAASPAAGRARTELDEIDANSTIADLEVQVTKLRSLNADKDRSLAAAAQDLGAAAEREAQLAQDLGAATARLRALAGNSWESKHNAARGELEALQAEYRRVADLYDTAKAAQAATDARLKEALSIIEGKDGRKHRSKRGGENTWWRHVAAEARTIPPTAAAAPAPGAATPRTDNLTHLGVTITSLRQQLLKAELLHRREREDLSELLRASRARAGTLEAHVRASRDANAVRIRELESALRVVSGRSDLHATLAKTQQQVSPTPPPLQTPAPV